MKRSLVFFIALLLSLPFFAGCPAKKEPVSDSIYKIENGKKAGVYPVPQKSVAGDKKINIKSVNLTVYDGADADSVDILKSLLSEKGVTVDSNSDYKLHFGSGSALKEQLGLFSLPESNNESEGYFVCVNESMAVLAGNDAKGCMYSAITFASMIADGSVNDCIIYDYPTVPLRGIVEGFYGEPWSHRDRLSMISFMARVKMNTYIYAPKDDKKHREEWRLLYEGEELTRFKELVDSSNKNKIHFVFAISPGISFDFNDYDSEFKVLTDKCESLYNLGVRSFAIFLDDLPAERRSPEGHAKLLNDFQSKFCKTHDGVSDLITVFAEYFEGAITENYTGAISKILDKDIKVMWTGDDVIAPTTTKDDMSHINGIYDRKLMIWWNYPVNDYAVNNLFIGPAVGLDKKLPESICGFTANPMNQAEASKIPLFTTADYLWNTNQYNKLNSYEAAIKFLHPEVAESVKNFCSVVYANVINNSTDSSAFSSSVSSLISLMKQNGEVGKYADDLLKRFEVLKASVENIKEKCANKYFVDECKPWLDKAKAYSEMGIYILKAVKEPDKALSWDYYLKFLEVKNSISDNFAVVSGNVIAPMFSEVEKYLCIKLGISTSDRFVSSIKWASAEISGTAYPTWQNFVITNALDNDESTYYWWQGASNTGTFVMLDLGKPITVNSILLKAGAGGNTLDYFRAGQMQYSNDGSNWTNIGEQYNQPVYYLQNLNIKARYIRYVSMTDQEYWLCLSEFLVNYEENCSNVLATVPGEMGYGVDKLFDGDIRTYYKPSISISDGQKDGYISFDTKDSSYTTLEVLQTKISNASVIAVSADGAEKNIATLDKSFTSVSIPENTVSIKIVLTKSQNNLLEINELIFK